MRIGPILTAIVVSVMVYLFVMERDTLLAIAGASSPEATAEAASLEEARPAVLVRAIHSKAEPVDSAVVLRGRTEAFRLLDVKSETSGTIISQPLRKGLLVEEGELLCELDPGTKLAALSEAKALLAEAKANKQVSAELVKKGFSSETDLLSREAALVSAQAAVARAEKEISYLRVTAPFSGLLESDTAEYGELMQPGAICARVIALDPIKLVGFATEDQIAKLSVGTPAAARLVAGQQIAGQVTFLSRSADPQTRTYRVEITAPNPKLEVRDGATAEIFVALSGETGHLLPQSALTLDDDGRLGVRIVDGSAAGFLPVTILRDTVNGVWVGGLPDQVDIIVVGQEYVTDGRAVVASFKEDGS
jgi:multidrug efflux system membrane fusion protein